MKEIPRLVEAIGSRRSVRNYDKRAIEHGTIHELETLIQDIQAPFDHEISISIHRIPENARMFYFKDPLYFAAFRSSHDVAAKAKLGFVGELFILRATGLGLSTCWMGHFHENACFKIIYGGDEREHSRFFHCTTPLGYKPGKDTLMEKMSNRMFSKKKSVEQNLHDDSIPLETIPDKILDALELACNSPSAMNSQCWKFNVQDKGHVMMVEIAKPLGYKHFKWPHVNVDVGTAASHFWLGIVNQGMSISTRLRDDGETATWTFEIKRE